MYCGFHPLMSLSSAQGDRCRFIRKVQVAVFSRKSILASSRSRPAGTTFVRPRSIERPIMYNNGAHALFCPCKRAFLLFSSLLSPPPIQLRDEHPSRPASPQCAFYILQNCKTMGLRFRQQCRTAEAVADMLEAHPKVTHYHV